VTDRVLSARDSYPRVAAFYDALLGRLPAFELEPDGESLSGPWVRVYRL
jgi:hypothetical protein